MRKLILLVILWFAVAFYFPDSRVWLIELSGPVVTPLVEWNTKEEMKQVGRDVVDHELTTGKLPDRRGWLEWLEYRYLSEDLRQDYWGSTYELKVWADSVGVWSYGADRTRQTEDDFWVSTPRQRRRR